MVQQILNQWGYTRKKDCPLCREEIEQANKNGSEERKECISCQDRKMGKIFEVLRVRNRFLLPPETQDMTEDNSSSGGYRDISFKIKVGFQVHVLDSSFLYCPVQANQCEPAGVLQWNTAVCTSVSSFASQQRST
jgi:hypothetical protein